MAHVTLKFKDLVLKEFPLEGGSKTIGREPSNDIVLENLLVSAHHARIDQAGSDIIITDLQSKNGTYVNGERITSVKLKDGDRILIGKHTLVFNLEPTDDGQGDNLVEATMFMEVPPDQAKAQPQQKQEPAEEEEHTEVTYVGAPGEKLGLLSYLAGGADEIALKKKLVKLGKGREADIQVGGLFTPRVAATISKRPSGYHLTPMGGRAKVRVNGAQLEGSYRLKEFDVIEVGSARLQFYYEGD
ncbi:MAG: FHA domain-containing protein [Deltaproteobacteria bacterium]|nr:FHA domain-containing protein [Deltaproteobacteria bacterium]MBW2071659.1 FHA domain-containing protein [Deltaproteobacteria bacterium]